MADSRTQQPSSYALQYNNGTPIRLKDFSGLLTSSQILVNDTENFIKRNRIQSLEYNEVVLTLPFPLAEPAKKLFEGAMNGTLTSVFTTISRLDQQSNQIQSYELGNCEILEIAFPSLNASSKDAGFASIRLKPEHIDLTLGNNSRVTLPTNTGKIKAFVSSNYEFEIDTISNSNKISKVSPVTIIPHLNSNRDLKNNLDFIEFKSIEITLSESEINNADWQSWLNDFVKNQQKEGRNGVLKYLTADFKTSLLEISVFNLFIISTLFHNDSQLAKITIELMFDFATITGKTTTPEGNAIRSNPEIKLSGLEIIPPDLEITTKK